MKRGVILLILLAGAVIADSAAPDKYEYKLYYDGGSVIQDWTVACDTNPNNDAFDFSSGYVCSVDVGDAADPIDCSEEGDLYADWRVYHEPDGGASYVYTAPVSRFLYNIDYDDPTDCYCLTGKQSPTQFETGIPPCCGDDSNEYIISTNQNTACCDSPTDFVHSGGICEINGLMRVITGHVVGQVPSGGYEPLEGARVVVAWDNWSTVNIDYTDEDGYYEIYVPSGVFHLSAQHKTHETDTLLSVDISANSVYDFSLPFTSKCQNDCTRFTGEDFRCDPQCDGINNCTYPNIYSDYFGQSAKQLCTNAIPGWKIEHNTTHDISCCSQGYASKITPVGAWIDLGEKIMNAQTFFAGVVNFQPTGELYSVYIIVYDR